MPYNLITGKITQTDPETLSGIIESYDGEEIMFFVGDLIDARVESSKNLTLQQQNDETWEALGGVLELFNGKRVVFRLDEMGKQKRAKEISELPETTY